MGRPTQETDREFLARVTAGEFRVFASGQILRLVSQGKELKIPRPCGWKSKWGYLRFAFGPRHALRRMSVHRAVWLVHRGAIPDEMEINHIDLDCSNCALANLEMLTRSENVRFSYRNGRASRTGDSHNNRKLSGVEVDAMRRLAKVGVDAAQLGYGFGVTPKHASAILRGAAWQEPTDVGAEVAEGVPF